ncbi:hypothetical protein K438DRAFT_1765332 [Mycena galopus ATCC 62051]|nr:hypothetical protein K438DRAFT_1765332 [Mycena galopus ATCC 62051]
MASVSPAEELELLQLIADAQTTNYLAAAGITLLVFEHISTFSEEVKFVWKTGLSLWSVLYVWIRYFTLTVVAFSHVRENEVVEHLTLQMEMVTCTLASIVQCWRPGN